jgi:hypothetical protein
MTKGLTSLDGKVPSGPFLGDDDLDGEDGTEYISKGCEPAEDPPPAPTPAPSGGRLRERRFATESDANMAAGTRRSVWWCRSFGKGGSETDGRTGQREGEAAIAEEQRYESSAGSIRRYL